MSKMDEMELSISLKANKWSHFFTVIALFVWTVYDFIQTHKLSIAFYILIMQNLIYYFVIQTSKWKMGDTDGRKSIICFSIGIIFVILIMGILAYFFPK